MKIRASLLLLFLLTGCITTGNQPRVPMETVILALAVVSAASSCSYSSSYPGCRYYYGRYYGNPGKVIINSMPTAQGGSVTSVKWYK